MNDDPKPEELHGNFTNRHGRRALEKMARSKKRPTKRTVHTTAPPALIRTKFCGK